MAANFVSERISSGYTTTVNTPQANRERNPDCIELTLNAVEIELGEALNSSANLADKLRGCPNLKGAGIESGAAAPTASDIQSRLQAILNSVRMLNQNLGNSHNAISG